MTAMRVWATASSGGQAEVAEEPAHAVRVPDEGDELHAPAALKGSARTTHPASGQRDIADRVATAPGSVIAKPVAADALLELVEEIERQPVSN